jgi:predicted nucleotidyltransferase
MSEVEQTDQILTGLAEAGVEFVVVGMTAGVLLGAPVVTFDVDILHLRTPPNAARLLDWLNAHHAYHRFDLQNRRLPPTLEQLTGTGHVNLQTDLGKLDVLCELSVGEGYDQVLADTVWLEQSGHRIRVLCLERLIAVKAKAGRPKDRIALPVLIATLEEQRKRLPCRR